MLDWTSRDCPHSYAPACLRLLGGEHRMHGSILALVGTSATVVPQPAVESIGGAKRSAEAMASVFGVGAAGPTEPERRDKDGKGGHAGASWAAPRPCRSS